MDLTGKTCEMTCAGRTLRFCNQKSRDWTHLYEYDHNGQPVTQTIYDYSEKEPEIMISLFRYKYDSHRNWIQKTEYVMEDDRPVAQTIIERTIKYY